MSISRKPLKIHSMTYYNIIRIMMLGLYDNESQLERLE